MIDRVIRIHRGFGVGTSRAIFGITFFIDNLGIYLSTGKWTQKGFLCSPFISIQDGYPYLHSDRYQYSMEQDKCILFAFSMV